MDNNLLNRLYSSDPNIILKHNHCQRIERQRKSPSTVMVNKFPRTSEMIHLCMSISTLDLNFENSETLVPESNLRKERILNIRILKNKAFLRLMFAYSIGSVGTALPQGYIPAFAMEQGIEATGAAWLLTIVNFSDLLDRFFVDRTKSSSNELIIAISMAISGTIRCLYPFTKPMRSPSFSRFFMDFFRMSYQLFILQCCWIF